MPLQMYFAIQNVIVIAYDCRVSLTTDEDNQ